MELYLASVEAGYVAGRIRGRAPLSALVPPTWVAFVVTVCEAKVTLCAFMKDGPRRRASELTE